MVYLVLIEEQAEEEKRLRKAKKKASNSVGTVVDDEDAANEGNEEGNADEDDGVSTLATSMLSSAKSVKKAKAAAVKAKETEEVEDAEDIPVLVNGEYRNLEAVFKKSDIVLQLLDARDPASYQSSFLESLFDKSDSAKLYLILNKIGPSSCLRTVSFILTLLQIHVLER